LAFSGFQSFHKTEPTMQRLLFLLLSLLYTPLGAQPFTLDPSFGNGGYVIPGYAQHDRANDLCIQPDGTVLVVGYNSSDAFVARFLLNGSPDLTFAADGVRTFKFGTGNNVAFAVCLQPDGKILVAGSSQSGVAMGVARFLPNGSLDNTFGQNGKRTPTFNDLERPVKDIAVQADGKIVLASAHQPMGSSVTQADVIRLMPDGQNDADFGQGGIASITGLAIGNSLALQADGKILLGGQIYNNGYDGCGVARLFTNGAIDEFFGTDGVRAFSGSECTEIKINPTNQQIYAAGYRRYAIGLFTDNKDIIVARLHPNGTIDTGFNGGVVSTNYNWVHANGMALQPDGKIVVAGFQHQSAPFNFMMARYNSNGTLDGSFGLNGFFLSQINGLDEELHKVLVMPDGRILATGYYSNNNNSDEMVLLRLTGGGITNAEEAADSAPSLALFPNPARDHIQIQLSDNQSDNTYLIQIFDQQGRMVYHQELPAGQQEVSVQPLSPGAYVLRMSNGVQLWSRSFIKME
jgi:uncharacterized delta-60 repeat protein